MHEVELPSLRLATVITMQLQVPKTTKTTLLAHVLKSVKAIGAVSNKTSDNVGTFKLLVSYNT